VLFFECVPSTCRATILSSLEIEMRCVIGAILMMVIVLRAVISSTETVPGPTFAV
jgi:hypothetical protein